MMTAVRCDGCGLLKEVPEVDRVSLRVKVAIGITEYVGYACSQACQWAAIVGLARRALEERGST